MALLSIMYVFGYLGVQQEAQARAGAQILGQGLCN